MTSVSVKPGRTEGTMAVDNNNVEEAAIVAKRLVQNVCLLESEKIGDVSEDFDVVVRERNSLDEILDDVVNGDDSEAEPQTFLVNGKNGDLLSDTAHDSGVESPLENSIGTDSDSDKKDDVLKSPVRVLDEVRSSSESGTENLHICASDDEATNDDCVMIIPTDPDVDFPSVDPVADEVCSKGKPKLSNGDSLELDVLPDTPSVIEDSHDSGADTRPASRRRKSTPKKRTYTPTAYEDSGSESDSFGDLDEAMEEADEMHILNAMSVDSMDISVPMEDDNQFPDLEISFDREGEHVPKEDVSVVVDNSTLLDSTPVKARGSMPAKGKGQEGLKKAEHKCPFCNFAYTSVNYVLSHLYRAHTDIDPVVLQNAIAQVTTWYKASATAKFLEQQAEAAAAITSEENGSKEGLDSVDGPLISNDAYLPRSSSPDTKDKQDNVPTHNRRTLMTQSYSCDKCNAKFKMHSQLETHMKRHRCTTPLPCNSCGMVFFTEDTLRQHKRTHLKESLLTCDTCHATFRDEVQFLEHQKTHNLKHDCVHCGRQYSDEATLTAHLKDHVTEGPIRCEKCDLWFADKSTLGQHLQIHGSDQLYQCQFCAYTFTEMAVLRRHTESHLKLEIIELLLKGESPKKLMKSKSGDVNSNTSRNDTTIEENKENDEKVPKEGVQYSCCLCPMTFPSVSVLLDHVYKAHSILNDNVRAMQQLLGLATSNMPLPMTPDMMNTALLTQTTPIFNIGSLYPQMLLNKPVVFNQMDQKQNLQNLNFVQNPNILLNLQSPNGLVGQPLAATKEHKSSPGSGKTISEILKPHEKVKKETLLLPSPPVSGSTPMSKYDASLKAAAEQLNGHYIDIKVPSFKAGTGTPDPSSPSANKKPLLGNNLLLPAKRIKTEPVDENEKANGLDCVDGAPQEPKSVSSPSLRAPLLSSMIAKSDSAQVACTPRLFGFESEVEKPFSCGECGKRFKRNCHLQLHMRTHTDDLRAYRCSQCGMKFIQLRSLEMHLKTHSIEKPYHCQFCGKSFAQKYNLKLHIRTHTGEKPYGCAYCEMRFADPGSLNRHTRTHTGEKPYKCEHCGKKFAQKYNLHLHLRIHTHERPFRCVYCDKRFVQKNNLLLHLKVHAEIAVQNGVAPTPLDISGNVITDQDESSNLVIDMSSITDQTTIPDVAVQQHVLASHMQAENQLKENQSQMQSMLQADKQFQAENTSMTYANGDNAN